jgi:hypothetical protein
MIECGKRYQISAVGAVGIWLERGSSSSFFLLKIRRRLEE